MEGLTISRVCGKRHCQTQITEGISFDLENLFLEMYPKENDWLCVQHMYEDVYIGFKK